MLHTVLIALHATAGVGCFAAGLLCIPLQAPGSWRFRVYAGSLLAMLAFVAGFALFLLWRAGRAHARLRRQDQGWRPKYLDDVGFTLISLFDGFVIVGAIDLGMPVWLVVLAAVGGVAAGVQAMKKVKTRLVAQPAAREPGKVTARQAAGSLQRKI